MIKIKKSKDGQYYYTVQGFNNEVLVDSEIETRKHNAMKGAKALMAVIVYMVEHGLEIIDETKKVKEIKKKKP